MSLTLPNSLEIIGKNAFFQCKSLTSLTLPNNLTTIGEGAFTWNYALTSVSLPHKLATVGDKCFYGCTHLTTVVFRPPVSGACASVRAFVSLCMCVYVFKSV